ncbi:hypothetical protein ACQKQD_33245 [Methylobacterium sp. NPDC080182]|uniref:hypothetical protein n=1 Tax=Methylobacterium sp. NPDC080182 TaxID=3390590 RepID=UPI003D019BC6
MNQDNRKRALSEVVSLDAWHKGFTLKQSTASLHVDIAFSTGRIGEEAESPVRFQIRLKQAEVVVIVPPHEPAKIAKSSVRRDAPEKEMKLTETHRSSTKKSIVGSAKAKLGLAGLIPSLETTGKHSCETSSDASVKIVKNLHSMAVKQIQTADGDYAWEIKPVGSGFLDGRPWNAKKQPRLSFSDTRPDRDKGIEPSVRVELRCRREDLEIFDIVNKEKIGFIEAATNHFANQKMAAAQALIRTRLSQSGLLTGDINDPYSQITICAIIAEGDL